MLAAAAPRQVPNTEGLLPQEEPNLGYEALIRWAGTGVYVCMCDEEGGRDSTNTTAIHHF